MQREPQSLQFNQITWKVFDLAENVLLLQAPNTISIDKIHQTTRRIKDEFGGLFSDIVPAYTSISLFYSTEKKELLTSLGKADKTGSVIDKQNVMIELPICYEMGVDLESIASHTGKTVEEVIEIHLDGTYTAILIGFTPGFIYMDGLDESLACPRKMNPRKYLESGSVGIGGEQTGIYSLPSPGGWNILGRTPFPIFDVSATPPLAFDVGTRVKFSRITEVEFRTWGK